MTGVALLTPEELKRLVREAIREELGERDAKPEDAPLTEEEIARARKTLRRMRGL